MKACAWALEGALRYAVATAVVALALATLLGGPSAERFATTAYVAAIVAAIVAVARWFLPQFDTPLATAGPRFPAIFTFSLGIAVLIVAGALAASQTVAEVRIVALCFGVIGAAAVVHSGAVSALRRQLGDADAVTVTVRYCAIVAVCALAAAALLVTDVTDAFAKLAYAATFVAALALAASLVAPLRAGTFARRIYVQTSRLLATPAAAAVFARAVWYAAATVVAGLFFASLLPPSYAERFATVAYLAALFAAFAIAARWRLRAIDTQPVLPGVRTWPLAAAIVAAWLVGGAALAFSPGAELFAIIVALYATIVAIRRAAPATQPA